MTSPNADRPPLQRIWAQHAQLHQRVRALHAWVESSGQHCDMTSARRLLEEIEVLLPEHFALEEQGGYFADVLSVAPHLRPQADALQEHHTTLMPKLAAALGGFRERPNPTSADRMELVELVRSFVSALEAHEQGENDLVRAAFQRTGGRPLPAGLDGPDL